VIEASVDCLNMLQHGEVLSSAMMAVQVQDSKKSITVTTRVIVEGSSRFQVLVLTQDNCARLYGEYTTFNQWKNCFGSDLSLGELDCGECMTSFESKEVKHSHMCYTPAVIVELFPEIKEESEFCPYCCMPVHDGHAKQWRHIEKMNWVKTRKKVTQGFSAACVSAWKFIDTNVGPPEYGLAVVAVAALIIFLYFVMPSKSVERPKGGGKKSKKGKKRMTLDMIRAYSKQMIDRHKDADEWFISFNGVNKRFDSSQYEKMREYLQDILDNQMEDMAAAPTVSAWKGNNQVGNFRAQSHQRPEAKDWRKLEMFTLDLPRGQHVRYYLHEGRVNALVTEIDVAALTNMANWTGKILATAAVSAVGSELGKQAVQDALVKDEDVKDVVKNRKKRRKNDASFLAEIKSNYCFNKLLGRDCPDGCPKEHDDVKARSVAANLTCSMNRCVDKAQPGCPFKHLKLRWKVVQCWGTRMPHKVLDPTFGERIGQVLQDEEPVLHCSVIAGQIWFGNHDSAPLNVSSKTELCFPDGESDIIIEVPVDVVDSIVNHKEHVDLTKRGGDEYGTVYSWKCKLPQKLQVKGSLKLAKEIPQAGSWVWSQSHGNERGDGPWMSVGQITGHSNRTDPKTGNCASLLYNLPTAGGDCFMPIFSENSNAVVGFHVAGDPTGRRNQAVAAANFC
jgi:hypothetical protein